jgi:hypothetical protein
VLVPVGTVALTLHVRGVVAVGAVQPGDCGVRFAVAITTLEAFAIVSDCVDGLTYAGRRLRFELVDPDGTRMTNKTVLLAALPAGGVGDVPPPPPHAASDEASTNTKTARRTIGLSATRERLPCGTNTERPLRNPLLADKESAPWRP